MTAREQMIADLEAASRKLQAILLNPGGKTEYTQSWHRARAAAQLNEVRNVLRGLKSQIGQQAVDQLGPAYRRGLTQAIGQARSAGIRPPAGAKGAAGLMTGSFSVIDRHALQIIAQDTVADLAKAVDGMEATAQRVLRKTAANGLTQGEINAFVAGRVITGDRAAAKRDFVAELKRIHGGNVVTIIDKNGAPMQFAAGKYAEMVVRTKTSEAVRKGAVNRFQELGQDLVIIHGARSKNFCTAFLGRVFSISGKSEKYPPLASLPGGGPPFHPNCSKSISLWVEELHTPEENAAAVPSEDERKMLGKDSGQAHRTWLDLQIHQQQAGEKAKAAKEESPMRAIEQATRANIKDPKIAESVVRGVSKVTDAGYTVQPAWKEDAAIFRGSVDSFAGYAAKLDTIFVNPACPHWQNPTVAMKRIFDRGGSSTPSPEHATIHEVGHYLHRHSVGIEQYTRLRQQPMTRAEQDSIAKDVSRYASINPLELVAEVFAMKIVGRFVPANILAIYKRFGGP